MGVTANMILRRSSRLGGCREVVTRSRQTTPRIGTICLKQEMAVASDESTGWPWNAKHTSVAGQGPASLASITKGWTVESCDGVSMGK
jgi:hypothetical protein